jgi:hypothetical protein
LVCLHEIVFSVRVTPPMSHELSPWREIFGEIFVCDILMTTLNVGPR